MIFECLVNDLYLILRKFYFKQFFSNEKCLILKKHFFLKLIQPNPNSNFDNLKSKIVMKNKILT